MKTPTRILTSMALLLAAAPAAHAAGAPRLINPQVASISADKVVFTTSVDTNGARGRIRLESGVTRSLESRSDWVRMPGGTSLVRVRFTLFTTPGGTYFWRLRATNRAGTVTSRTRRVTTPGGTRRVMPVARTSFAFDTDAPAPKLGRLLGFTRPARMPAGTRLIVRCARACEGGRTVFLGPGLPPGEVMRFDEPIVVGRESLVIIRAVRDGWIGRQRGYRFVRVGERLELRLVSNRCLTDTEPPRTTSCSAG